MHIINFEKKKKISNFFLKCLFGGFAIPSPFLAYFSIIFYLNKQ